MSLDHDPPPHQFLGDIRVIDLSQYVPGPYATRQLADLGADVIKIEPPQGDPMRKFMYVGDQAVSPVYRHLNRGKRVALLDLKADSGRQILMELLTDADVLLESYRPGVLQRLGFGRDILEDINPGLIHCALSGYGQTGPYRLRAGHDLNYCAATSQLSGSGTAEMPIMSFPPIADHAGAMQASITILAALHARERSNKGAFLDISLFETALSWQYVPLLQDNADRAEYVINGGAACYNIYQCQDQEFISLGAIETHFWQHFCEAIDRPHWIDRQYETMPQKALISELSDLIAQQPLVYWNELLASVDCCYEPVILSKQLSSHVQIDSRHALGNNGPVYPGWINHAPVTIDEDYVEIQNNESIRWQTG